jgi:hypothetical protein
MCPTRELVLQNLQVLRRMAKYTTIKAVSTADEVGGAGGGGPGQRRVARRAKLTEQVRRRAVAAFIAGGRGVDLGC